MTARVCAWCSGPIDWQRRSDVKTCSKACRQAKSRFRVAAAADATGSPRLRVAYADPPYPGLARKYYGCDEVDHVALVEKLVRQFPDGWALSTSAEAQREIVELCPAEARSAIWVRGARSGHAHKPRSAYEVLITYGGRQLDLAPGEGVSDVLVWGGRQHSVPGSLIGMKPAAFCEWMFRLLGLEPGDELVDLFSGSGSVGRAWDLYTSSSSSSRASSRLAEAQSRVELA